MHHVKNIGKRLNSAFLCIIGIPKGMATWCVDLFYIKNTLGFSLATGLFSFLTGLFLIIQIISTYGISDYKTNIAIAFFWGLFSTVAGAMQLYSASINNLKLRQVSAIIQLLMYLFFLSLTFLTTGSLILIAILLSQIILLLISSIRITQELNAEKGVK